MNNSKLQKIYFHNNSIKQNIVQVLFATVLLIMLLLTQLGIIKLKYNRIELFIFIFFFFIMSINSIKPFIHKNYVQWNKQSITIKTDNFWGTNINYKNVSKINYDENKIEFVLTSNQTKTVIIKNIEPESKYKLTKIIKESYS